MKKNLKTVCFFAAILMLFSSICGCKAKSKKQAEKKLDALQVDAEKSSTHTWYYFTQDGFAKTDKPSAAPFAGSLPYTEAIRISSANSAATTDETLPNKAYALVNRLGVLCFNGADISLSKDISVFTDRTAANLVFVNDTPVFSVYKSAFFNGTIDSDTYKKDSGSHYFLIQFDSQSKISYPVINCTNLSSELAEVTDFFWNGSTWYCCLKTSQTKTDFSYIKFTLTSPFLSISPVNASNLITVQQSDVNEYRDAMHVMDYSLAPERIRKMLRGFTGEIPFTLEVKSAGGTSPRVYENIVSSPDSSTQELNAKAIIAQSWSAALFEDGTLFIEGALPGKHILRGGKAVAIRLPKLEKGFIYSDFVISGTSLYAAWEETDFYKIRRSGFLCVDLDSTLYSKIR